MLPARAKNNNKQLGLHYSGSGLGFPLARHRAGQNSNIGEATSTLGSSGQYFHHLLMWPIPTIPSNLQEPESQRMPDRSDDLREARKREGNITADISVQVSTLQY